MQFYHQKKKRDHYPPLPFSSATHAVTGEHLQGAHVTAVVVKPELGPGVILLKLISNLVLTSVRTEAQYLSGKG